MEVDRFISHVEGDSVGDVVDLDEAISSHACIIKTNGNNDLNVLRHMAATMVEDKTVSPRDCGKISDTRV